MHDNYVGDVSCLGTINFIKHDGTPWYSACPNVLPDTGKKCMKKVFNLLCFMDMYMQSIYKHRNIYIYICI
jgi:hypothetical protein